MNKRVMTAESKRENNIQNKHSRHRFTRIDVSGSRRLVIPATVLMTIDLEAFSLLIKSD